MITDKLKFAEPRMYKLPEAARLLGRSSRWVRGRIVTGEIEAFSLPNLVIPGQSINTFLAARRVTVTPKA